MEFVTAEEYLKQSHVLLFLEDAANEVLAAHAAGAAESPVETMAAYFACVARGEHVLFREYTFVACTLRNRRAFVKAVWSCYKNWARPETAAAPTLAGAGGVTMLAIADLHALVRLVCADFPLLPVQEAAQLVLMEDSLDCLVTFSDFAYAFQFCFIFTEFIASCRAVFAVLLRNNSESKKDGVLGGDVLNEIIVENSAMPDMVVANEIAGSRKFTTANSLLGALAAVDSVMGAHAVLARKAIKPVSTVRWGS